MVDDKNGSTIWTAPEADGKKEERQIVVEGSSSSARPSSMPEADAVPVEVAIISLKMTTKPLWKLKIREAIIDASAQAIDPRHPVISGFFVQVSTSPCPRCRFEVIDGMLSCGQCAYIIQGKKTSQRDSVITTTSCRISFEDRRRARDES